MPVACGGGAEFSVGDLAVTGPSRLRRMNGAFSVRVNKNGNRLPEHLIMSSSVSVFKKTVKPCCISYLLALLANPTIDKYIKVTWKDVTSILPLEFSLTRVFEFSNT